MSKDVLGRCFNNEGHNKHRNRDGATEVGNVCVESFHAVFLDLLSLLFFSGR